ncbi:MAG TPA: PfkB family carbohydrate kinase [Terriglobales bacterium]|nr:PfkB family carbohydrate kinase [Terriglobales bacterium]
MRVLRIDDRSPFQQLVGVGGLGTGIFFALEGNQTLGRNESRLGALLDVRDYCKLHIVIHYIAKLLGGQCFRLFPAGNVGSDEAGRFVLREMSEVGIDTRFVKILPGKPTLFSVCFQYPDGAGGNITTNNSAAAELSENDFPEIDTVLAGGPRTVALSLPEVPLAVRDHFLKRATRAGAFRAASFVSAEIAAAKQSGMFEQVDLVSLNEAEAAELIGSGLSADDPGACMVTCLDYLRCSYPHLQMVISCGKNGAYALNQDTWNYCPVPPVDVASTAGAGDCLLGGVLAAMAAGIPLLGTSRPRQSLAERPLETALEFGVLLASYKVTSPHTIHPAASLSGLIEFAEASGVQFGPSFLSLFTESPTI